MLKMSRKSYKNSHPEIVTSDNIVIGDIITFAVEKPDGGIYKAQGLVVDIQIAQANRVKDFLVCPLVRKQQKMSVSETRSQGLAYIRNDDLAGYENQKAVFFADLNTTVVPNNKLSLGQDKPNFVVRTGQLRSDQTMSFIEAQLSKEMPAGSTGISKDYARKVRGPQRSAMSAAMADTNMPLENIQERAFVQPASTSAEEVPDKTAQKDKKRIPKKQGNVFDISLQNAVKFGFCPREEADRAQKFGLETLGAAAVYFKKVKTEAEVLDVNLTLKQAREGGYFDSDFFFTGNALEPRRSGQKSLRNLRDVYDLTVTNPQSLLNYKWLTKNTLDSFIGHIKTGFDNAANARKMLSDKDIYITLSNAKKVFLTTVLQESSDEDVDREALGKAVFQRTEDDIAIEAFRVYEKQVPAKDRDLRKNDFV